MLIATTPAPITALLMALIAILSVLTTGCEPVETEQERRSKVIEARFTAKMHRRDIPEEYRPPAPPRGQSPYFYYTMLLNVPGVYFANSVPSGGRDYQNLKLDVMLPDLRPRWPEQVKPPGIFSAGDQFTARTKEYFSHHEDVVHITITDSPSRLTRGSAARIAQKAASVLINGDFHGLEFYRGVRCADAAPHPATMEAMKARDCWFDSPDFDTAGNPVPPAGYYVASPLGDNRGIYFECIFRCVAFTRYKSFSLDYSFKREHLVKWKEIDHRVEILLDGFYQGFKPAPSSAVH